MAGSEVAGFVRWALDDVEAALRVVLDARGVEWRSPAAERYRAALDDVGARLRLTRARVAAALHAAAALDAAVDGSVWRGSALDAGEVWL
ncbi:hypothetical protein [Cellulomonas alba]|uniref:DUF222 domain-containing protein n=1 Tax=Cellulomonas alba TaxID=3053467 RepID=A0ABT7SFF4_9CELL|nr:hypothetical protein [Cellulomonas alba]MDM7854917.1 hypothetical protein [Cellulomonas alba]